MTAPKKRFNRIKIVLIEKDKSNTWLADQLGISKTAVSKWCTNRNQPTIETLYQVADILEVEVFDLLLKRTKKE